MTIPARKPPAPSWRSLRLSCGLALSEVARRADMHKGDLSRIETGRLVPTPHEAEAILRVIREERERQADACPTCPVPNRRPGHGEAT